MTSEFKTGSRVRLLPQEVIHRIAAGEVVDRPLSVLKELLENSLDAGSTHIKVVLVDGGQQLIEVEDNGGGMSFEDLEVAVQRHATSKIQSMEDLEQILSLGFRGEALSAISSVTRLEIESARDGQAWLLEVLGGLKKPLVPSSRSKGTRVRAHDLFFNIPARRKFLKKSSSEAADCLALLESFAMIHPDVAFEWHAVGAGGELKAQHELAASTLEDRFRALCPKSGDLYRISKLNPTPGIVSLEIIGLRAPAASNFQKSVQLSVNGRLVVDKRLPFSMREAYQGLIEVGAYPHVYVRVEVEPSLIDVNIHPQKKEIRWPSGFSLAGLAYGLLRPLFQAKLPDLSVTEATQPVLTMGNFSEFSPTSFSASIPSSPSSSTPPVSLPRPASAVEEVPAFRFSSLKVVGEVSASWIVCEHPQGMLLIDQHAAHERINFEKILNDDSRNDRLLRSKPLLLPLKIDLPLGVDSSDERLIGVLEELGFEIGDPLESSETLEFVAVPDTDRKIDWPALLEKIFEDLLNDDDPASVTESLKVRLAASLSCHGSVRRGQRLSHEQIQALLKEMDEVTWGGLCPHGRPVWFLLSNSTIEETFHR